MTRKVTPTYTLINQIVLASSSASITFNSLPQNFGDLVLSMSSPASSAVATIGIRFNGDTGNNYLYVGQVGTGSSTGTSHNTQDRASLGYLSVSSSGYNSIGHFMDYATTDKNKHVLVLHGNSTGEVAMVSNRWANSNAVTRIEISAAVNSFPAGSIFSLFGVVA